MMNSFKKSSSLQGINNCDKTLQNGFDFNKKHSFLDPIENGTDTEIHSENIRISQTLGCNYEKDLKNDLLTNTDKIGATRNEFHFETDHDALRGNPDYLSVLKTLAILEAQKIQAVKDLEILQNARNSAVKDPLSLISKLQNGDDLKLPGRQKVAQLPYINWDKYGLASLSQLAAYSIRKPETRRNVSSLISQVGRYLQQ